MMPEDIHVTLWKRVGELITSGVFATTPEFYQEMIHITGDLGECIREEGVRRRERKAEDPGRLCDRGCAPLVVQ